MTQRHTLHTARLCLSKNSQASSTAASDSKAHHCNEGKCTHTRSRVRTRIDRMNTTHFCHAGVLAASRWASTLERRRWSPTHPLQDPAVRVPPTVAIVVPRSPPPTSGSVDQFAEIWGCRSRHLGCYDFHEGVRAARVLNVTSKV